ncbi:SigE family RNA polymerase sigma factor [Phytomonospora endophytica]|uniref:RNA polymerase sigma-70 factor (Sigma-E family) n=1 Tax=Phytomonospora endophytica TaxID=714109 RepID=A0A841FLT8_9ACTN|nr:SigE family RNA polymerase sigma factor [Phytomonospora endophytica]MBB6036824.1 RNA polymerase sigma-70 factor (sigma-E family) [Phytomonospora endophytica]GIG68142.1 DNA-directed RNA polymerase sigma-70 factor [Phytomonospora endophytica]
MDRYEGLREFVAARGAALSRTAFLLCGDHAAAQDLAQEALVKTARHWNRVKDGNPEAYVRKVMVNHHLSWWRRRGRHEHTMAVPPAPLAEDETGPVADRLAMRAALAGLPPRQRAVIVLRYFEDLSERDTAVTLGVTVGTVKRQSSNALANLRKILPDRANLMEPVL